MRRLLPLLLIGAIAPAAFAESPNLVLEPFGSISTPPASNVSINVPIAISNHGPGPANDVQLTLEIPTGATFEDVSPAAPLSCTAPPLFTAGDVVCSTPALPSGQRAPVIVTVQLTANAGTTLEFDAKLTSSNALTSPQTASTTVLIPLPADMNVSMAAPATVYTGDPYENVVTVQNRGSGAALQVRVSLSAGGVIHSQPIVPAGWTCTSTTFCTIDSFAPGTAMLRFPSTGYNAGKITATVSVSLLNDPNQADNEGGPIFTTIQAQPPTDLSVSISGSPTVVHTRDLQTYTVRVTNTGTSPAINVGLPPPQLPGRVLGSGEWDAGPQCCFGARLDPGATATATFVTQIDTGTPAGPLAATASARADNVSGPRTASTTTTNLGLLNLDLQPTLSAPAVALPGVPAVWTIGLVNNGPDSTNGWDLFFKVGALVSAVTTNDPGVSCVMSDPSSVHCSGVDLANNRMTAQVTAMRQPYAAGTIQATATAYTPDNDPHPENNVVSAESGAGQPGFDLQVTLDAGVATVAPDGTAVVTLHVLNIGNANAPPSIVVVPLAPSFTLAEPQPLCDGTTTLVCSFVTLIPGHGGDIVMKLRPTAEGVATLTATATTSLPEVATDNNTATMSVTVLSPGSRRRSARH
jgi:hypothetical protein